MAPVLDMAALLSGGGLFGLILIPLLRKSVMWSLRRGLRLFLRGAGALVALCPRVQGRLYALGESLARRFGTLSPKDGKDGKRHQLVHHVEVFLNEALPAKCLGFVALRKGDSVVDLAHRAAATLLDEPLPRMLELLVAERPSHSGGTGGSAGGGGDGAGGGSGGSGAVPYAVPLRPPLKSNLEEQKAEPYLSRRAGSVPVLVMRGQVSANPIPRSPATSS